MSAQSCMNSDHELERINDVITTTMAMMGGMTPGGSGSRVTVVLSRPAPRLTRWGRSVWTLSERPSSVTRSCCSDSSCTLTHHHSSHTRFVCEDVTIAAYFGCSHTPWNVPRVGPGHPSCPLVHLFPLFTFLFLSLALPIFFFCPSLPFLPE